MIAAMRHCPQCNARVQLCRLVLWSPKKVYRCIDCSAPLSVHEHWNKLVFFLMWLPLIPVTRYGAVWWHEYGALTLLILPAWLMVIFGAACLHKVVKVADIVS